MKDGSSDAAQAKMSYRADIDGLRAVAVLLVLASHLKIGRLEGGYVGVDVFFVISGFLISSIILNQIANSSFSIVTFYERRIRRIFPALMVMLFATMVAAYIFFLPPELMDYCRSLLAANFSGSNIFFWQKAGYFDAPAAVKPLLHTWSLGVEEQFYIVFPLILIAVKRFFPTRIRTTIVSLAIVSFIISVVSLGPSPSGTFYLAHTRAWELLIGTIVSMRILPPLNNRILREAAAALGLLLIAFAAVTYNKSTPFPGVTALPPCLGAALIIAAGQSGKSLGGQLLSLKPVVFIGLISYSLYLWHWPIIVFQSVGGIFGGDTPGRTPKIIAGVLSILAGYLSWQFVEKPFRAGRLKFSGADLFRGTAVAIGAVTVLACIGIFSGGFKSRFTPEENRLASYIGYKPDFREGQCFITPREQYSDYDANTCLKQDPTRKNYLILGDSHAAHLWHGLSNTLDGVNVLQATASGCKPILGSTGDPRCVQLVNHMYNDWLPNHHIDKLLLACFWGTDELDQLRQTLLWAKQHNIQVVLLGPVPVYDTDLPRLLVQEITKDDPSYAEKHRVHGFKDLDLMMANIAKETGTAYISYVDMLCKNGPCTEYTPERIPLQFDATHFTSEGSILAARAMKASNQLP